VHGVAQFGTLDLYTPHIMPKDRSIYFINSPFHVEELNGKTVFFNMPTDDGPFNGVGRFHARTGALGNTKIDIEATIHSESRLSSRIFHLTQAAVDHIRSSDDPQADYTLDYTRT